MELNLKSKFIFMIKGQIATQPVKFNNADLRRLSAKLANTPFLLGYHILTWYLIKMLNTAIIVSILVKPLAKFEVAKVSCCWLYYGGTQDSDHKIPKNLSIKQNIFKWFWHKLSCIWFLFSFLRLYLTLFCFFRVYILVFSCISAIIWI